MRRLFAPFVAATILVAAADDPRTIVNRATSAVRADSAARLTSEWRRAANRGAGLDAQGQSGELVAELFRTALARARVLGDSTDAGEAFFRLGSLLMPMGNNASGLAYVDSALLMLPASAPGLRAAARCRRAQ